MAEEEAVLCPRPPPRPKQSRAPQVMGWGAKFCPLPRTEEGRLPRQVFPLWQGLWQKLHTQQASGLAMGAPVLSQAGLPQVLSIACLTPALPQPVPFSPWAAASARPAMLAPQPPHTVGEFLLGFYDLGYDLQTAKHTCHKNRSQTFHLNCPRCSMRPTGKPSLPTFTRCGGDATWHPPSILHIKAFIPGTYL